MRWCTKALKIRPLEEWIGDAVTYSYVAIRADEHRAGYVSTKPNIRPVFPFKEDGIVKDDVVRILDEAGIGMPEYYAWRTRSGCYFCFFQRKVEWVGLAEHHPELFEAAVAYEDKVRYESQASGEHYTWSHGETLRELIGRKDEIVSKHDQAMTRAVNVYTLHPPSVVTRGVKRILKRLADVHVRREVRVECLSQLMDVVAAVVYLRT